jgi:hypothetical protein
MNSIPMGPKELRNVVWPLLRQPMPREEVARGVASAYNIEDLEAMSVVDQLDVDLRTCMDCIRSATRESIGLEKEKARKAIPPIADEHFEAMWDWAGFIIQKGG